MSDGESHEGNQEMEMVPADYRQQREPIPRVLSLSAQEGEREGQYGGRENHEEARQTSVQKRKQGSIQELFASLNGLSAGLFAATSVAERQVTLLDELRSVFSTSCGNPEYLRNASLIPILSEYPVQVATILKTIEELIREREAFIRKVKSLMEYMEIKRYIV